METSITSSNLKDCYEQLYGAIRNGNLDLCLELHLLISAKLRETGALLLANRHHLMARRIGRILDSLNDLYPERILPVGEQRVPVEPGDYLGTAILKNEWLESLEIKLINHLKGEPLSEATLLNLLFGGYATDLTSEKILKRVVDNINRQIGRIIEVSPDGYRLKVS